MSDLYYSGLTVFPYYEVSEKLREKVEWHFS